MDRHLIVYFLVALLILLLAGISVHFVVQSKKRAHERQQRQENQASRERMAAKRMAENGGLALSEQYATSATTQLESGRYV